MPQTTKEESLINLEVPIDLDKEPHNAFYRGLGSSKTPLKMQCFGNCLDSKILVTHKRTANAFYSGTRQSRPGTAALACIPLTPGTLEDRTGNG
jgi:hypothetical protein